MNYETDSSVPGCQLVNTAFQPITSSLTHKIIYDLSSLICSGQDWWLLGRHAMYVISHASMCAQGMFAHVFMCTEFPG